MRGAWRAIAAALVVAATGELTAHSATAARFDSARSATSGRAPAAVAAIAQRVRTRSVVLQPRAARLLRLSARVPAFHDAAFGSTYPGFLFCGSGWWSPPPHGGQLSIWPAYSSVHEAVITRKHYLSSATPEFADPVLSSTPDLWIQYGGQFYWLDRWGHLDGPRDYGPGYGIFAWGAHYAAVNEVWFYDDNALSEPQYHLLPVIGSVPYAYSAYSCVFPAD